MSKTAIAGAIIIGLMEGMLMLAITYAFIPIFFPQYIGTPQAWAYTLLALIIAGIFAAILLWIINKL